MISNVNHPGNQRTTPKLARFIQIYNTVPLCEVLSDVKHQSVIKHN